VRKKLAVLMFAVLMFLFAAPFALSADEPAGGIISPYCGTTNAYSLVDQVKCEAHTNLLGEISILSESSKNLMADIKKSDGFAVELDKSTDIFKFTSMFAGMLLAFMATYTGYMYISSAGFPEKREKAQEQLKNIVFAAVFVVALMPFITLTGDLGQATTNMFYEKYINQPEFDDLTTLDTFADVEENGGEDKYLNSLNRYGYLTSTNSYFTTSANMYLISLHGRKVALMFLVAIAPLALLLYFFEPTKEFGKLFLYLYFIELFIPIVFILVLRFASILAPADVEAAKQMTKMTILTASLFFAVFLHAAIVLAAIGKSVFNVIVERRIMARRS
jgi:hypothetical protein